MRKISAGSFLLLTAALLQSAQAQVIAITGAELINSNGDAPIKNSVVLIEYGKIVQAGHDSDVKIPSGAAAVKQLLSASYPEKSVDLGSLLNSL